MDYDKELEAARRRAMAHGWEQGFLAGCQYGREVERYDPNDWADEPVQPVNPYRPLEQKL
jgi:hypothetical protein